MQSTVLLSEFGNKTTRIRKQELLSFEINGDEFENIFLVCSQLINGVILGSDFLFDYGLAVDVEKRCLTRKMTASEAGDRHYEFVKEEDIFEGGEKITDESGDECYVFQVVPVTMDDRSLISNVNVET